MKKKYLFLSLLLIATTGSHLFAQVPDYVPTNGLVGWWPFTGNANDISGNGHNGSVTGAVLTADRNNNANNAYYFDGNNDYISVPHDADLSFNESYSISMWFRMKSFPSKGGGLLVKGDHGEAHGKDHNYYMSVSPDGNGKSIHTAYENSYGSNIIAGSSNLSSSDLNTWTHIVGVREKREVSQKNGNQSYILKLYVDGVLIDTVDAPATPHTNTQNLVFGKFYSLFSAEHFNGDIDDIGMWNRALTDQEVLGLYNSSPSTSIDDCLAAPYPISLYPNPTNSGFRIDGTLIENGYGIIIYNSLGQSIYSQHNIETSETIDLAAISTKGVHYVKILDNAGNLIDTRKVILQ